MSKTVDVPAIKVARSRRMKLTSATKLDIPCFCRCVFGPELLLQSQLVIIGIQFGRFEQATNFGEAFSLSGLCSCLLLLFLFSIKLRVISGKLL